MALACADHLDHQTDRQKRAQARFRNDWRWCDKTGFAQDDGLATARGLVWGLLAFVPDALLHAGRVGGTQRLVEHRNDRWLTWQRHP